MTSETSETRYAVWYAAAGCLPDGDGPEYIGTLEQCEQYVSEHSDDDGRPTDDQGELMSDAEYDTYGYSIDAWDDEDDEDD